jgi:competence protein ComEC
MKIRYFVFILVMIFSLPIFLNAKSEKNLLQISFLDVGQGDAIYIEAPNGRQMIIDGGPGSALERALAQVMPYTDRSIDVIVITNPDLDHYSGFIDLLEHYEVGAVVEPGTVSKTASYQALESAIIAENSPHLLARTGTRITLDQERGVYFEVLFPNQDVTHWTTNDGSIIGKLVYGDTSVMFTGDSTKKTEQIVLSNFTPEILRSDILKVGHHGSKTSSGTAWLSAVAPKEAIISVGCDNRYGHPAAVTLSTLASFNISHQTTCEKGTITMLSDGIKFTAN